MLKNSARVALHCKGKSKRSIMLIQALGAIISRMLSTTLGVETSPTDLQSLRGKKSSIKNLPRCQDLEITTKKVILGKQRDSQLVERKATKLVMSQAQVLINKKILI